jgi:hypothetical protein
MATRVVRTICRHPRRRFDMRCPVSEPLEDLLNDLAGGGWTSHFNEIDAAAAKSLLARCTNCDGRVCFDYVGMKSTSSYRAFWICERCGHWTEV